MKICPKCSQTFGDDSLNFCLMDGTVLEQISGAGDEPRTAFMDAPVVTSPYQGQQTRVYEAGPGAAPQKKSRTWAWVLGIGGILAFVVVGGLIAIIAIGYKYSSDDHRSSRKAKAPPAPATPPKPAANDDDDLPEVPDFPDINISGKGDYDVTMAKYNQLRIGQSREEVEAILGGKGTEISSSTGGGMSFSVNKWDGDNFKSIILSFKNEKIMSKSQVGLK